MARVAARISDRRVLANIRAVLNAGVMGDGLVVAVERVVAAYVRRDTTFAQGAMKRLKRALRNRR
jgi:hypothetical protein